MGASEDGWLCRNDRAGNQSRVAVVFTVPHLLEQGTACVEEKLRESLLFSRMTVLHYRAFGGSGKAIYRAGAAVELMILSLDIIDDLQDKDNKETVWSRMSPEIALNIALGLLTLSQQMLLTSDFPEERASGAARLMNEQVLSAINGQTTDLLNDIESEEEYIEMVRQKSAGLLVAACMIGTLLATGEIHEEVRKYAEELGIAAQMKNDIRDLLNWDNKNDFWNRKKHCRHCICFSPSRRERTGSLITLRHAWNWRRWHTAKKRLSALSSNRERSCILLSE